MLLRDELQKAKATVMHPIVLYMLLCDKVDHEPEKPWRLRIEGFLPQRLRWPEQSTTPLHLERLVVLLILTNGHAAGWGRIDCINEETGMLVSHTPPALIQLSDPLLVTARTFTLRDCYFPTPGAYLVRFFFEDVLASQQSLIVR
jgi:hypothetical protein